MLLLSQIQPFKTTNTDVKEKNIFFWLSPFFRLPNVMSKTSSNMRWIRYVDSRLCEQMLFPEKDTDYLNSIYY